ncbi:MAG: hypothetical protein ACM3W4_06655 [Ignavibacteriales bacterium]
MIYRDAHKRAWKLAAALAAAALALGSGAASAQDADAQAAPAAATPEPVTRVGANLNISPKRLTFDKAGKSATVYIFNQGSAPAAVDIDLIDRVMQPDGQIVAAEDAAQKPATKPLADKLQSAKPLLIATPRRAVLGPGKGQTIRIRVMPGPAATAAKGEYRTHLTVTTIPPKGLGLTADEAAGVKPGELSFTVYSVFGISIPVIVRLGAADVRAAIDNPHFEYVDVPQPDGGPAKRTPVLDFDLVRQGASSLFGNIEIRAKANGKDPIGLARGVGVYTEIDRRAMKIPLSRAPAAGETLEITFTDDDTSPGRVLARSDFTAPR